MKKCLKSLLVAAIILAVVIPGAYGIDIRNNGPQSASLHITAIVGERP